MQGKNAGKLEVLGEELVFSVDGKRSFDISLGDVSRTQATPKDEIILEFAQQVATPAFALRCLTSVLPRRIR